MRFTLQPGKWYACEFVGDEFDEDKCSYSPIKIYEITPLNKGDRTYKLNFYHANYLEGVQEKEYSLRTIERGRTFLLAKAFEYSPSRYLQIYDIDTDWVRRHFPEKSPEEDIQEWLERDG